MGKSMEFLYAWGVQVQHYGLRGNVPDYGTEGDWKHSVKAQWAQTESCASRSKCNSLDKTGNESGGCLQASKLAVANC